MQLNEMARELVSEHIDEVAKNWGVDLTKGVGIKVNDEIIVITCAVEDIIAVVERMETLDAEHLPKQSLGLLGIKIRGLGIRGFLGGLNVVLAVTTDSKCRATDYADALTDILHRGDYIVTPIA